MVGSRPCSPHLLKALFDAHRTSIRHVSRPSSTVAGTINISRLFSRRRIFSPLPLLPFHHMPLRHHSSQSNPSSCQKLKHSDHEESDDSDHEDHDHSHPHSHSHSLFGHSHAHEEGPNQEVESLVKIFEGKGDRGSNITLVGLVVNVGLTASKGFAGFFMNSAALLAEAGHSASGEFGFTCFKRIQSSVGTVERLHKRWRKSCYFQLQ